MNAQLRGRLDQFIASLAVDLFGIGRGGKIALVPTERFLEILGRRDRNRIPHRHRFFGRLGFRHALEFCA